MRSGGKNEQHNEKELLELIKTFSRIQEALIRLDKDATCYKDKDQMDCRLREMNKLLESQLSLLDRLSQIE